MKRSREIKYQQFFQLTNPSKDSTILDVGVADEEYSPYDNYLEKKYLYPHNVTALSVYPLKHFSKRYPDVKVVTYDGNKFPFKDNQFSIVFSNAVIEHVGGFEKQLLFINEMYRVGESFYFASPAKEFPLETHTHYPLIHWLSDKMFDKIVEFLGKNWAAGDYMHLLSRKGLKKLLRVSNVSEYKIMTHRFGPFPLHYAVWGR